MKYSLKPYFELFVLSNAESKQIFFFATFEYRTVKTHQTILISGTNVGQVIIIRHLRVRMFLNRVLVTFFFLEWVVIIAVSVDFCFGSRERRNYLLPIVVDFHHGYDLESVYYCVIAKLTIFTTRT